jgi:hypothetical protein
MGGIRGGGYGRQEIEVVVGQRFDKICRYLTASVV